MSTLAVTRHPGRWVAFIVLLAGAIMDLMDATIVNVALPSIGNDLRADGATLEWVASGYLIAFAATLIAGGRIGDRLGRKMTFLVGVFLFGVCSLAAGLAQQSWELIALRVAQGFTAGLMIPQVLGSARNLFDGEERGRAFAIYGAIAGLSVAVALLASGAIVEANFLGLGWRPIFLINVPVAVVVVVAGLAVVPETRDATAPPVEGLGTLLLVLALSGMTYIAIEGQAQHWPVAMLWLGAGTLAALAGLFVLERRQEKTGNAMLPTSLLRHGAFSAALLIQLLFSAAMGGFFFILTIWLQIAEGFSPFAAGLTSVAFSLGTILLAATPEKIVGRQGKMVLVAGGIVMGLGVAIADGAAIFGGTPINAWLLTPGLLVAGAGLALLIIPLSNVALSAVPPGAAGAASGMLSTAQQLGGAVGVGGFGGLFFASASNGALRVAFEATAPYVALTFVVCGVLAIALPSRLVTESYQSG